MIDKNVVAELAKEFIADKPYELITCTVSADNRVVVEVDSMEGVDVDFCAEMSRFINDKLDREIEDYELEVGSVSITDPFKTLMQYRKHIGHPVEVLTADGKKLHATLLAADEAGFTIEAEVMVAVEGKKKKQKQLQQLTLSFSDAKYCKYDLKI